MTDGLGNWRQTAISAMAALAVVGLIGAVCSLPEEETPSWLPATENIAFDLGTTTGSRLTSAELGGTPTIVWFWASWCSYSQDIADEVAAESKRSGDRVRFVGIGGDASMRSMKHFVSDYDVAGIEHGADLSGDVADRFGVTSFPSFAVVYPEGGYELVEWVSTAEDLHDLVEEFVA